MNLFDEINHHLLMDEKPSEFLIPLSKTPGFRQYPFELLHQEIATEQSPKHHPEGSVWNHTLLVVDAAATLRDNSKSPRIFMWAALLHDIGKPSTTRVRKGRITSYDHDRVGAKLAEKFLLEFEDDMEFILGVTALVRWHMQVLFVLNKLPFADVEGLKREVDILEIALLGFCDRMGRLGADREKEEENIKKFVTSISK